jgi:serine/threonine protein phosphatase PrpC
VGPAALAFGVATRPHVGSILNGDTYLIKRWGDEALVGVIDGLGHGPHAHHASQVARYYIERHYEQSVEALFAGVGRECQSTGGGVMALARFDCARGRFHFGSVGNVEARVFESPEPVSFMILRGVVGLKTAPKPAVTEHAWAPGSVLVLHSDGLTTRWRWSDYPHFAGASATAIARELLRRQAKDNDDATVVVVKQDL